MNKSEPQRTDVTIVANDIGPVGGMERQLTELISGLLAAGHQVTVISWTCSLPANPGLRWIRVPGPSRPFAIAYPCYILLGSLLVWLRGRGVVHSTGAIVLNRTSVSTVHFCHHGSVGLPGVARVSRPGIAFRMNARIVASMKRRAERWCYRPGRAKCLVGVSEGVARELRLSFPKMRERISVISNGVDTDLFCPSDSQASHAAPHELEVLFVGSEWERKGLRIAIQALDGLSNVRLVVVGKGDIETYRGLAVMLGLGDRVRFVGATTDVASWYRRANVFLLPTAYETFSLVTYEAAACGLPLLVTKVNGVEDLLRDGVNGWFIDRNPENVRERLRRLQSEPQLRAEMGAAARRLSLRFSWSTAVESYRELYAGLSGTRGGKQ